MFYKIILLDQFNIYCIWTLFPVLNVKFYSVVFLDFVDQSAGMYKSFFTGIIMFDEAKSFVDVKELYRTC